MIKPGGARWLIWIGLSALLLAAAFLLDPLVEPLVANPQNPVIRTYMRALSNWGDGASHVVAGVVGMAVAYALGNRRWAAIFAVAVIACAMAGILHPVLKVAAGRSRPSVERDAGWHGMNFDQKYQSFPSGHTISSTAFFGVLLFARRRVAPFLLAIPILIAVSRVYLNAHYLSDVVAGAIFGFGCAALAWHCFGGRIERLISRSRGS